MSYRESEIYELLRDGQFVRAINTAVYVDEYDQRCVLAFHIRGALERSCSEQVYREVDLEGRLKIRHLRREQFPEDTHARIIQEFDEALKTDDAAAPFFQRPNSVPVFNLFRDRLRNLRDRAFAEQAIKDFPERDEPWIWLIEDNLDREYAFVNKCINRSLVAFPKSERLKFLAARIEAEYGDLSRAKQYCKEIFANNPLALNAVIYAGRLSNRTNGGFFQSTKQAYRAIKAVKDVLPVVKQLKRRP